MKRKPKTLKGLPIIDATKPLHLEVTAEDVRLGSLKKPDSCAIARACKRQFKTTEVLVFAGRIFIRRPKAFVRYRTPASLHSEIIAFDRGAQFAPGEYNLPVMPPSYRAGARGGHSLPVGRHKLAPMQKSHRATGKRFGGSNDKGKSGRKRRPPQHEIVGIRESARKSLTAAE